MRDFRIGDKVRLAVEGEVENYDVAYNDVKINGKWHALDRYNTVEVIEPRGPQVGDTIEGTAAYTALPVGAVLRSARRTFVRTSQSWVDSFSATYRDGDLSIPRELVFLP